jgi:hypothetical protein
VRVLNITRSDTGGQTYRTVRAFARHSPDIAMTGFAIPRPFPGYPMGPYLRSWQDRAILREWGAADVVHVHNRYAATERYRTQVGDRPSVISWHGSVFRNGAFPLLREAKKRGSVGCVSTVDLMLFDQSWLRWIPSPFDLAELAAIRAAAPPRVAGAPLRIAHAPTNRDVKGTAVIIAAVRELQARGHAVELDVIEGVPWQRCLQRKALADVFVDQLYLGYGNNAVEAWGMGLPVVCGVGHETADLMRDVFETGGTLPFYRVSANTLADDLVPLIESADERAEWATTGYHHARRWHEEQVVVSRLTDAYHDAGA